MLDNRGTNFYHRIHHDKLLSHIPAIVVSGIPEHHLAIPKPFVIFEKPIDEELLARTLKHAIGK